MTLYHGFSGGQLMCIHSLKVRWMAEELGVRYRIVDIDLEDKPPWFGSISPKLQCPVACIQGKVIVDSRPIMDALLDLAGVGEVVRPEFASRQSWCSIDTHTAELAVAELGAFLRFVSTPPTGPDAAAAQDAWEESIGVFEDCLSHSGKPFLCGDEPGRLDSESVFWRIALPVAELAIGWKAAEHAPYITAWVDRMEKTASMERALEGTARRDVQVMSRLETLSATFPSIPHLQDARDRAAQLVGSLGCTRARQLVGLCADSDLGSADEQIERSQQLTDKVRRFSASIVDGDEQREVILQFAKSAFLDQVKVMKPPRRGYTVDEWTADVLGSIEQKKLILQSMISAVTFKVASLHGSAPFTPWMRCAQDGCILVLVGLRGKHVDVKGFLDVVRSHRESMLQMGLIGAAIPRADELCVALRSDDDAKGLVIFGSRPVHFDDKPPPECFAEEQVSSMAGATQLSPALPNLVPSPTPTPRSARRRVPPQAADAQLPLYAQPSKDRSDSAGPGRSRQTSIAAARWKRAKQFVTATKTFKDAGNKGGKEVMHVASSRKMSKLHPKNWYFLLLEVRAVTLAFIFMCVYSTFWLMNVGFAVITAPTVNNPDDESKLFVGSWMTVSNLVGIGYTGNHYPLSFSSFAVGTLQQFQGIILQAFVFTVAVTRFQMPKADLIFSDSLLFTNRDRVPNIIFRIGNLRCNMIFHPHVELTVLKQHRTIEGESYVSMETMDVDVPSVMGGSITVTHKITESSPLFGCVRDGEVRPEDVESHAFSVTFAANDDTYQAEVNAMKRYACEDFQFGKRFEDVMIVDGEVEPGKAPKFKIDFDRFHETRDLAPVPVVSPGGTATATPALGAGSPSLVDVKMCL